MRNRKTTSFGKRSAAGEYVPVKCSIYAQYELAILKGQALRIAWTGHQHQSHVETLYPVDLRTRWHSEFMIAHNQLGQQRVLRLDRIQSATVL
ncbi:MAG TPA: transcriptional antiterminator, Rof [Gammaproteobacteria bacterium]|nr:transcriptional antiterminator, Rof [Gammaproteobacteria bacterium]